MTDHPPGPDEGVAGAWSTTIDIWSRDIDYLGHVTSASYLVIYEEARLRFFREIWATPMPTYAVVRQALEYEHEITLAASPVTVHLQPVRVGTSSLELAEIITDSLGRQCNRSSATLVAWDSELRCSRPLTADERTALRA